VDVVESAPVEALPEVARLPLHAPDAVHDVALLEDQESVAELPDAMGDGLAEKLRVGGDG
jgi:hypothetical protein